VYYVTGTDNVHVRQFLQVVKEHFVRLDTFLLLDEPRRVDMEACWGLVGVVGAVKVFHEEVEQLMASCWAVKKGKFEVEVAKLCYFTFLK
jgi:hypothetical protein